MKYAESIFDIFYLLFAVITGVLILIKSKDGKAKLVGTAVLVLGIGDAFHLVPRVLNYFSDADFTAWLGFGKLVTSVTMTVFYLILYRLWLKLYSQKESVALSVLVYFTVALRIVLCLMPQNGWLSGEGSVLWALIRNIPFIVLGCIIICLFFVKRRETARFKAVWLLVTLSFVFYIPVAVGASFLPMLGMLMLPKTVCYMLLIWLFFKYSKETVKIQ